MVRCGAPDRPDPSRGGRGRGAPRRATGGRAEPTPPPDVRPTSAPVPAPPPPHDPYAPRRRYPWHDDPDYDPNAYRRAPDPTPTSWRPPVTRPLRRRPRTPARPSSCPPRRGPSTRPARAAQRARSALGPADRRNATTAGPHRQRPASHGRIRPPPRPGADPAAAPHGAAWAAAHDRVRPPPVGRPRRPRGRRHRRAHGGRPAAHGRVRPPGRRRPPRTTAESRARTRPGDPRRPRAGAGGTVTGPPRSSRARSR